jgi:PIN domain nuclease of toxin-antitoxin system
MSFLNCRISFGFIGTANSGLCRFPPVHKDPFDRILMVQAKLTGSTLVSPDKIFSQSPVNLRWG